MKWTVPAILILSCVSLGVAADKKKEEKPKPAQSIPELQQQLEKILKDTHTPGVSVAIVHKDGPEWIAGLGVADVASGRANTADTLFRIGSTSKAFSSLSILLLTDQGKLTLQDPVHKLVPDVFFENRWEASDPIRVVNLLEHTTGWDDMHLREYAKQAPDSMSLHDGLDYDRSSRVSRWRPGTRMAYCNSGPPVAAYVVEKLTGQRFEDFVQQNLFVPIGMKTATYFEPMPARLPLFITKTARLRILIGTSCCDRLGRSTLRRRIWRRMSSSTSIEVPPRAGRSSPLLILIAWRFRKAPGPHNRD